jgi:hypothetical protein
LKVIYLKGGLGNQLFQYAFGRALQWKLNCVVKFDLSFFDSQSKRLMCLDKFNTNLKVASNDEIQSSLKLKSTFLEKLIGFLSKKDRKNPLCIEKNLSFDEVYLSEKHKSYFKGYWQSEKYFKDIDEILRKELTITYPPSERNSLAMESIKLDQNAVSLHIRRGDYISEDKTNEIHGICGMDYYYNAVSLLKNRIGNFNLYIFSDDIFWVKENFKYPCNKVYIDWNDDNTNYEDLRLMSLCKHNIIANSSFSWWGAWLNNNPKKIVIAPKRWFADENWNAHSKDIIPGAWVKI